MVTEFPPTFSTSGLAGGPGGPAISNMSVENLIEYTYPTMQHHTKEHYGNNMRE